MRSTNPKRRDRSGRQDRARGRCRPHAAAVLLVLVCLTVLSRAVIAGGPPPVIGCGVESSGQRCLVSRLPPVIADHDVVPYLTSGLTATFVLTLSAKDGHGRRMTAGMRIEVRFEPWNEVFFAVLVRPGAATEQLHLGSQEKLRAWWSALKLPFVMAHAIAGAARLEVTLIPFSGEEERETRQWYAETLRVDRRQADDRRSVDERPLDRDLSRVGEMLDSLTLTSIKRHGVLRFEWSVPVERTP